MEHLIDLVAEQLDISEAEPWFTSLGMQYVFGRKPLDKNTTAQCNF